MRPSTDGALWQPVQPEQPLARNRQGVAQSTKWEVERETGFEPATFCLGSSGVPTICPKRGIGTKKCPVRVSEQARFGRRNPSNVVPKSGTFSVCSLTAVCSGIAYRDQDRNEKNRLKQFIVLPFLLLSGKLLLRLRGGCLVLGRDRGPKPDRNQDAHQSQIGGWCLHLAWINQAVGRQVPEVEAARICEVPAQALDDIRDEALLELGILKDLVERGDPHFHRANEPMDIAIYLHGDIAESSFNLRHEDMEGCPVILGLESLDTGATGRGHLGVQLFDHVDQFVRRPLA